MPVVTVVHIALDNTNDPGRVARRHDYHLAGSALPSSRNLL